MISDAAPKGEILSPVKLALIEIRKLRQELEECRRQLCEPVAVVGIGCRFPGGIDTPEEFWRQLMDGADVIAEIPPERWAVADYYDPDPQAPGKMYTKWGGFLKDIDRFDADFFGISFRESVSMDPQQRLLLEVAWESLENAGIAPHTLFGSATGVYVGIGGFDYGYLHLRDGAPEAIDAYLATGSTHSVASGRLSYFLGLQGPSVSLDTACSSSLVSVHLAVQGLRARECDLALAGGVNLILTPEFHVNFSKSHVLAADGRCKTFDASADGFVRSEGCGMVVLQRLSDALAQRAPILAVIRGSAINQDGRSSGLTVPNGPSQQSVIRKALENAGMNPGRVRYVEAHGTGTSLGDPIEVQALGAVYGQGRTQADPLLIGSVKTNLGHLETAAGAAGLIKLVMAVHNGRIPPHLHVQSLNPFIPWQELPLKVTTSEEGWPQEGQPRAGAVSSFGFSGTNAHVIVEQAPAPAEEERMGKVPVFILPVSGKSPEALEDLVHRYAQYLSEHNGLYAGDLCYTACVGRTHFDHRAVFIAENREDLQTHLSAWQAPQPAAAFGRGRDRETVFLFTGKGSAYVNMGRVLYETQPAFRENLDHCSALFESFLGASLTSALYPPEGAAGQKDLGALAQPALFAFEQAMASLWRSWGIEPAVVIGQALGGVAAACVAGIFDLEGGVRLIAEVSRSAVAEAEADALIESIVGELAPRPARVPIVAAQSGDLVPAEQVLDGLYWAGALRATSQVETGIRMLNDRGYRCFLEVGPDSDLGDIDRECAAVDALWLPSVCNGEAELPRVLSTLGQLYVHGFDINWSAFYSSFGGKKIQIPTYPFQRERCWLELSRWKKEPAPENEDSAASPAGPHGTAASESTSVPDADPQVLEALLQAPAIDRHDILVEFVRADVMRILRRDPSKPVARNQRLMDLGIDSLMAVELRTSLKNGLGLQPDLPATLIFDYPTVAEIAIYLENLLKPEDQGAAVATVPGTHPVFAEPGALSGPVDIAAFGEDEVEALLKARLDLLEKGD
jgi:acyl transferase domain-containing protein/acyl carrier protein